MEVLRKISKEQLLTYQRRQPKLSDLELISLSLTSEFMGIDSENDLFRKLPKSISSKIERSVYNKRRRRLSNNLNVIRLKLASYFNDFENYFIVDSMPLEKRNHSRNRLYVIYPNITIKKMRKIILTLTVVLGVVTFSNA